MWGTDGWSKGKGSPLSLSFCFSLLGRDRVRPRRYREESLKEVLEA